MATLIILLISGVLLQVLCRIFSASLNFKLVVALKIIAYALVIFSAIILVFFNPQVFKEFQGYVCACMVALFYHGLSIISWAWCLILHAKKLLCVKSKGLISYLSEIKPLLFLFS